MLSWWNKCHKSWAVRCVKTEWTENTWDLSFNIREGRVHDDEHSNIRLCSFKFPHNVVYRGGIRSTRGLGPTITTRGLGWTITAQGQSIGISIGMLPQTMIMSRLDPLSWLGARILFFHNSYFFFLLGWHGDYYGTKDIQVLHYGIWPWRMILKGACINISNLLENIAWQTHKDDLRPEARGPLKSGAWSSHPTCHPQTPAMVVYSKCKIVPFWYGWLSIRLHCGLFQLDLFLCR
jgi:hypothetical protein